MNREDIERMALEAGFLPGANPVMPHLLERFANLVYEATFRDANIAASRTILDAAVLEEREACAKVCDDIGNTWALDCADAIRARSNP